MLYVCNTFTLFKHRKCLEYKWYPLINTIYSISAFRKPYLFVVHFASVEVMKLSDLSFIRSQDDSNSIVNYPEQTFIELSNPRFLGK